MDGPRPSCVCHGEPMYWNRDLRKRAGGYWRCAVIQRARVKDRYDADPAKKQAQSARYYHERMPPQVRAMRGLRDRRAKALIRRRERRTREGLDG